MLAALPFLFSSSALADASAWHQTERGAVRLVSAAQSVGRTGDLVIGVEMRLTAGWKTYWRHPGESGFPPQFDWSGSVNVAGAEVVWPAPERFQLGGLDSIGYASRVMLPIRLNLAETGKPAEIRLRLTYAVCREVCVPEEALLRLALPRGAGTRSIHAAEIERFAGRAPRPGAAFGWRVEFAGWHGSARPGDSAPPFLMITLVSNRVSFVAPDMLIEGGDGETFGRATVKLLAAGRRAHFITPIAKGMLSEEKGRSLALTVLDGRRAASFMVEIGGAQH